MLRSSLCFLGAAMLLAACGGEAGEAGAAGAGCTVADNGDATYTVTCAGKAVTLKNGVPGAGCAVTDNGDKTYTIDCAGQKVTVESGAPGASCTVKDNGDGTKTLACGTAEVTVKDGTAGAGCTVADKGAGTYEVDCGGQTVTLSDGTAGAGCTVTAGATGTYEVNCGGQKVTLSDGASCTVEDNNDGTKKITCGASSVTVSDGGVDPAVVDALKTRVEKLAGAQPESCAVCHKHGGQAHQDIYNQYADKSTLTLTIDSVVSVANPAPATNFTTTVTFTIMQDHMPYLDDDKLPSLPQMTIYAVKYDSATRQFTDSKSFSKSTIVALGGGQYAAKATDITYAPELSNAQVYAYTATEQLDTEGPSGLKLYNNVASAAKAFGNVGTYTSAANVSGCEKCHGKPYMKHGYRAAQVAGLPDFSSCKSCHYDTRNGNHQDWQLMVDAPVRWADLDNTPLTDAEKATYAYKASIMNDVHMSHSMEFPYPQSMANCATCHEGKLDMVLSDANFKLETCKSCHVKTGSETYKTNGRAFDTLWAAKNVTALHDFATDNCGTCHKTGGIAPTFKELHTGYDAKIYADAVGTKYSTLFKASIDAGTTYDAATHMLTVHFSVTEDAASTVTANPADVVPTLIIGLYGYDTKHLLVAPHNKDAEGNRLLEFPVDGTTTNPRFTLVSGANGAWVVKADLSMWADMIADGSIKRAEIGVMPALKIDDVTVALDAPSMTYDLTTAAFDNGYYPDVVDVEGCNKCHDALATTFHSANRGGSIKMCKMCHVPSSGGSHLEMQSRSIDSYVHAIHSFQDFDTHKIDFTDPVLAKRYELHIEHTFPNFTIKNCQACHNPGTFNPPDQHKSLPSVLSAAGTWNVDRNIGAVPSYVVGPGSRACGSCHRAYAINEDDYGALIAFNRHTQVNGYLLENEDGLWDAVVKAMQMVFQ